MYNEINALEAVERDLAQVTNELQEVVDLTRAVEVLMSTDPDFVKRSGLTVLKAAEMVTEAYKTLDDLGAWNSTLAESLEHLNGWQEGLKEEIECFQRAHDELLLRSRGEALKFIERELKGLEHVLPRVDKNEKFYEGKATAYENVLGILNTFSYE